MPTRQGPLKQQPELDEDDLVPKRETADRNVEDALKEFDLDDHD